MNKVHQATLTQIRMLTVKDPATTAPEVREYYWRWLTEVWQEANNCRLAIMTIVWRLLADDELAPAAKTWLQRELRVGNRLVLAVLLYEAGRSQTASMALWWCLSDVISQAAVDVSPDSDAARFDIRLAELTTWEEAVAFCRVPHGYDHLPADVVGFRACRIVLPDCLPESLPHVLAEILGYREWHSDRKLQQAIIGLIAVPKLAYRARLVIEEHFTDLWPAIVISLQTGHPQRTQPALAEFVRGQLPHLSSSQCRELLEVTQNLSVLGLAPQLLARFLEPTNLTRAFIEAIDAACDSKNNPELPFARTAAQRYSYLQERGATIDALLQTLRFPLLKHYLLERMRAPLPDQLRERLAEDPAGFEFIYGEYVATGRAPLRFIVTEYIRLGRVETDPIRLANVAGWLANFPIKTINPTGANEAWLSLLLQWCVDHQLILDRFLLPKFVPFLQQVGVVIPDYLRLPPAVAVLPRDRQTGEPIAATGLWQHHFIELLRSSESPVFLAGSLLLSSVVRVDHDPWIEQPDYFEQVIVPACAERPDLRQPLLRLAFTGLDSSRYGSWYLLALPSSQLAGVFISGWRAKPTWFEMDELSFLREHFFQHESRFFQHFHRDRDFLDWLLARKAMLDIFYRERRAAANQPTPWVPWLLRTGSATRYVGWLLHVQPRVNANHKAVAEWCDWAVYVKDDLRVQAAAATYCESEKPDNARAALAIVDPDAPVACAWTDPALLSHPSVASEPA